MTDPAKGSIATTAEYAEADAMPRARVAHCDPSVETCENQPFPPAIAKPKRDKSPAEWAYERVILYIQNFEKTLDSEHEVAMGFAGGDSGSLHIQGVGFFAPDLITFYGADPSGAKTQLVQHVSQLSVMLRAAPLPKDQKEPMRIGFQLAAKLEEDND
ncbi:MAG: DUF6173 family protein [Pseudomonadota bacterium]